MRSISYLILFFTSLLWAQESQDKIVFLDSLNNEATADNYSFKRIIKDYYTEKSGYQYLDYYKSGSLKSSRTLSGKDSGYYIGEEINYYPNGNKKESSFYEEKRLSGKHTTWYENGKIREEGSYNADKFNTKEHYLVQTIWDEKGTKMVENGNGQYEINTDKSQIKGEYKNGMKEGTWTSVFTGQYPVSHTDQYKDGIFVSGFTIKDGNRIDYDVLEKRPEPAKGLQAFYNFISKQFKTSPEAISNKVKGKIFLSFVVDKDGSIIDVKVIRGLGYGLDEEAIRVLKLCPSWTPGEQRGVKVKCKYSIPIALDYSK